MKAMRKAAMAVALAATAAPALAANPQHFTSLLEEQDVVFAPRGFQELCAARPEFCVERQVADQVGTILGTMERMYGQGAVRAAAPELTPERYAMLERVNLAVNASIQPREDLNGDHWSFSAMFGDCEEYVLMKRETLAHLGWPRSAMRIAVVRGTNYPYHAVLVVATDRGEFVLDNMTDQMDRLEVSAYEFVVTQSAKLPGEWVRVKR